ncbi:MAG TPA: FtsX-like permease family protein [Rectinemataceae bacterium]|nr:FtsX-like permease family protein [Rectinemataceae bacterium]
MLTLKLAIRTLARRKARMALIGLLVAFGTFLIVFGETFARSAAEASKASIINNFTGDFIVYSDKSKELPSPFAFNTPLPVIRNLDRVEAAIAARPEVAVSVPYAQNYGLLQVVRDGKSIDLPFIFYAVDPERYQKVFSNLRVDQGGFFTASPSATAAPQGVLVSSYQNAQYLKNYGVRLKVGEPLTLLGITEGGVNTRPSRLLGIFEPLHYTSVFNYINFMDAASYSQLYDFTGVQALPDAFNQGLASAASSEDSIFGLAADKNFGNLDLASLKTEALSGYTMIAVKLRDHASLDRVVSALGSDTTLGIKVAKWDAASGFYAQIAASLEAFIYLATALVFLVVALIVMNTLIINVTERTAEIGTMRAIGGDRSFIRGLFVTESLVLNLAAALIGMVAAAVAMALVGTNGVPLPDTVSQFLMGGGSLPLHVRPVPFFEALLLVLAVSVLATIYPVRVATKITPLRAMSDR